MSRTSGKKMHDTDSSAETTKTDQIPPSGIYPAKIVHYGEVGGRVTMEALVQWCQDQTCSVTRQFRPDSKKGMKLIAVFRRAAGLNSSDGDCELKGRDISVRVRRTIKGGKQGWEVDRFIRPTGSSSNDDAPPVIQPDEYDAIADRMIKGLSGAKFVKRDDSFMIVQQGFAPIPIDPNSDTYAALQYQHTGLGTVEYKGKIVAQRMCFRARQRAEQYRFVLFSYADVEQVLLTIQEGKLLRITEDGWQEVDNGTCGIWLEHPRGEPFPWNGSLDPCAGLIHLERLFVDTVPHPVPEWCLLFAAVFVFVPLLRHLVPTRPVAEITGPTGSGKTTNARRSLHLFKLGDVLGDYSIPKMQRDGDVGFVVRDNVEAKDLSKLLENYFVFAATGAEWGRVGEARHAEKPVIAVTTVEGIGKQGEMKRRLLRFDLRLDEEAIDEALVVAEIEKERPLIIRAVVEIIRTFMAQPDTLKPKVAPMPEFHGFCTLVYRVLRAWQQVGNKPVDFADNVMQAWLVHRQGGTSADAVGFYPRLLEKLLATYKGRNVGDPLGDAFQSVKDYAYGEYSGELHIGTPTSWLTWLKQVSANERDLSLPSTEEGLRNRLLKLKPAHGYLFITEKEDGDNLKRSGTRRQWGILELLPSASPPQAEGISGGAKPGSSSDTLPAPENEPSSPK
jgi:hypothetical protein